MTLMPFCFSGEVRPYSTRADERRCWRRRIALVVPALGDLIVIAAVNKAQHCAQPLLCHVLVNAGPPPLGDEHQRPVRVGRSGEPLEPRRPRPSVRRGPPHRRPCCRAP